MSVCVFVSLCVCVCVDKAVSTAAEQRACGEFTHKGEFGVDSSASQL